MCPYTTEARMAVACADAVANAMAIAKTAAKKKARAMDDFGQLLRSARREIRPSTTWEAAEAALGQESAWRKCVGNGSGGRAVTLVPLVHFSDQ